MHRAYGMKYWQMKAAPKAEIPQASLPPYKTLSMDREQLIAEFTPAAEEASWSIGSKTSGSPGSTYRGCLGGGLEKGHDFHRRCHLQTDLPAWGKKNDIQVMTPASFPDRYSYRDAVFDQAQAGITGADFAVRSPPPSVSSTIRTKPSGLPAPILHIAIVPVDRIVPLYEQVIEKVFAKKGVPSSSSSSPARA